MITTAAAIRMLGGPRAEGLAREIEAEARLAVKRLRDVSARVRRPVTLRDVRRAASHRSFGTDLYVLATSAIAHAASQYDGVSARIGPVILDRLISRHGPDYVLDSMIDRLLADEAADEIARRLIAERTNHKAGEDAPVSDRNMDTDASAHGGDGNSGEMDHCAAADAPDRDTCASASAGDAGADTPDRLSDCNEAAQDCHQAGQQIEQSDTAARKGAGTPTGEGAHGPDEGTREMGSHQNAGPGCADNPGVCGDPGSAESPATDCVLDTDAQPQPLAVEAESRSSGSSGGQYLSTDPISLAAREARAARSIAGLLRRIVEPEIGTTGDPSPRVDGRALVREMVSRRYATHRALRRETAIRDLIIMVDESWSCAKVVDTLYATALGIAQSLPIGKASVLLHSNGRCAHAGDIVQPYVHALLCKHAKGLKRHYFSAAQQKTSEAIWYSIARRRPGMVLALGDHDADWAYQIISDAGVRVVLCTRYAPSGQDAYSVIGPVVDSISAEQSLRAYL